MLCDERGDLIISWLIKLALVSAIVGILVIEGGAIVLNNVRLDEDAGRAVRAGAQALGTTGRSTSVEDAITASLESKGVEIESLHVGGGVITLTVQRRADLLVLGGFEPVASRTVARVTKTSS